MSLIRMIALVAFASLVSANTFSQNYHPIGEGQPETLEQALARHHIILTKGSLLDALRNPNAEVRQLAAQKLADAGATDAIPFLKEALKLETVSLNRTSVAYSLAQLGDSAGSAALKSICEDAAAPGFLRMTAVQYLQWLHDDSCVTAVAEVLRSEVDQGARIQALSLVPSWQHLSESDSKIFLDLMEKALGDPATGVRMTASSMLGRLGDVSAIRFLQSAFAKEQDDGCRLQMGLDLRLLQRKKGNPL